MFNYISWTQFFTFQKFLISLNNLIKTTKFTGEGTPIFYFLALLAECFLNNNANNNEKIVQLTTNTTQEFQQNFIRLSVD